MSITSEREEITEAVSLINDFAEKCNEEDYTDSGDAWQVMEEMKSALLTALQRYDLMGWG